MIGVWGQLQTADLVKSSYKLIEFVIPIPHFSENISGLNPTFYWTCYLLAWINPLP